MAHAAEKRQLVALEAHARSAPVTEAAPGELVRDRLRGDAQAGREPLDDDDESPPVRFPGGEETEHAPASYFFAGS